MTDSPRITLTLDALPSSWYDEHPDYPRFTTGQAGEAEWMRTAHKYLAILHNGAGGAYSCPYYTGAGWTETPSARDVLQCVLSDAVEDGITFEEWCAEYGYDDDSRRALAMYEHARRQTPVLEAFLGPTLFAYLREHDETEWPRTIDTATNRIGAHS